LDNDIERLVTLLLDKGEVDLPMEPLTRQRRNHRMFGAALADSPSLKRFLPESAK
jgi:hypothetical protein